MKTFCLLHFHRFGFSRYIFKAKEEPTEEQMIEQLMIHFEPDRDESLQVEEIDLDDIPTIEV